MLNKKIFFKYFPYPYYASKVKIKCNELKLMLFISMTIYQVNKGRSRYMLKRRRRLVKLSLWYSRIMALHLQYHTLPVGDEFSVICFITRVAMDSARCPLTMRNFWRSLSISSLFTSFYLQWTKFQIILPKSLRGIVFDEANIPRHVFSFHPSLIQKMNDISALTDNIGSAAALKTLPLKWPMAAPNSGPFTIFSHI